MTRRSPLIEGLGRCLALLLLPLRAPLLLLLFAISVYLGLHWTLADAHQQVTRGPLSEVFWSIDCLHAVLVVFICTMPDLLLQRVSSLMAASRVVSLVISLLIVTVGGLYLLHLNVLANVLILASGVLLARLDLVRVRTIPPPWLTALGLSVVVLIGSAIGRHAAGSWPA
ncbi:MAG: hypothetical protein VKM98_04690 [Cyanobacteriota bacterium]|nr:hypothetical protein [Cyanobacteriota bacterium]